MRRAPHHRQLAVRRRIGVQPVELAGEPTRLLGGGRFHGWHRAPAAHLHALVRGQDVQAGHVHRIERLHLG
ncbi:hypothetical protein AB0K14_26480 [Actinosynnema sp. NPDC050801]|uniref:hypothetical protein n=1 Tax=unclassified Actinosynnema TaxID=2637065 RepID=UPI0033E6ABB3